MSKGPWRNVNGTSSSAHVRLGLAPGEEKHIISGLRYLKHSWSKQIHFKSPLCWQRVFTRFKKCQVSNLDMTQSPALSVFGEYSMSSLQYSEHSLQYIQYI